MKEALQRAASSQESILELSDHEDSVDVSAGEAPSSASSAQDRTSVVTSVTHGISVKHDPKTGGLAGLPAAWTTLLPDGALTAVGARLVAAARARPGRARRASGYIPMARSSASGFNAPEVAPSLSLACHSRRWRWRR